MEYKGKYEERDTSALEKNAVLEMKITQTTQKGKLVQITDLSGVDYYKIEYQINSIEGEWKEIKSGATVEVEYGAKINARLVYGTNKGIIHSLVIESIEPIVKANTTDTNNIVRKTQIPFANLFDITWGSDGTGTIEYSISGNLGFRNVSFNSETVNDLSELEIGTYIITCKITSPLSKVATDKKEVKVTKLANTTVTNTNNNNVIAYAIYSEYDLAYFRDLVNKGEFAINAKLMNDINLSNVCSSTFGSWSPIGEYTPIDQLDGVEEAKIYYDGIFDGKNYKIENLYIRNAGLRRRGLFSIVKSNAIIKNIELFGSVEGTRTIGRNCWNFFRDNNKLHK